MRTCKGSLFDYIKLVIFVVLCALCPKVGYFFDKPRTSEDGLGNSKKSLCLGGVFIDLKI